MFPVLSRFPERLPLDLSRWQLRQSLYAQFLKSLLECLACMRAVMQEVTLAYLRIEPGLDSEACLLT